MSDSHPKHLDVRCIGDMTVVGFRNKWILDEPTIQELFDLAERLGRANVLLNFGGVLYVSSAVLGKLVKLYQKIMTVGGRLSLCNVDPRIYEVFELTKLDRILKIDPYPAIAGSESGHDSDGDIGGVPAGLKPVQPSGGAMIALQPPSNSDDDLIDNLIANNPEFQALLARSAASPTIPFVVQPQP